MAISPADVRLEPGSRPTAATEEQRRSVALKWWAALGAAFVALQIYVLIYWIARGHATPTSTGADDATMPGYTRTAIHIFDVALPLLAVATIYWFLIRPWRRDGHMTTGGMVIVAWLSLYLLQDPLLNYSQTWFLYNSEFVNLGSWTSSVPGWLSPNGHLLPEPLLTWGAGYILFGFLPALLGVQLLRWGRKRWPQRSTLGLLALLFPFYMALDFLVEIPFLTLGMYAYAGSIRDLTLFAGETYQFPIYEMVGIAMWWTASSCLMFFVDDRGRTLVERGSERMRFKTTRARQTMKLLAIIGFVHLAGLAYNIPMQWFGTHADPFPAGYESYMLNGMCGPGTGYACAGPDVPIPRAQ